ncbi:hypothetical protein [Nonomuraea sp. NPDC005692]|uniref:hypothetical protein n=1 Tax=Nonomuraea sp. NPDC005692 TaxID=3157168 RepID=UPI0033DBB44C
MATVARLPVGKALTVRGAADAFPDALGNPNTVRNYTIGFDGPEVPAWAKRLTPPDSETPARSKMAIDRLIACREVHLREKRFYRMLYETVARAEEILPLNIEDLDFAGRRALVKAKGAQSKARRRGQAREDFVLKPVYWDAGTARLLPRLLKNRTRGPVFVTHLGEQRASLLMLMAKSRHKKAENVRRYFKPSPDAIAELTGLLAPGDTRRGGGT